MWRSKFLVVALVGGCTGEGKLGVVGDSGGVTTTSTTTPTGTGTGTGTTSAPTAWTAVTAATYHACALTDLGTITCWGRDTEGEVDDTPTDAGYKAVRAGGYATVALDSEGYVVQWGQYVPQTDLPPGPQTYIDAGSGACSIAADDGSITCWGNSQWEGTYYFPPFIPPTGAYSAVAVTSRNACAIEAGSGALVCWGDDQYGAVSGAPEGAYSAVDVAVTYGCALSASDGRLDCWGQKGDLAPNGTYTAVSVAPSGVSACALDVDGAVDCWGEDGVGVNLDGLEPEGSFESLSVGIAYACAVASGGGSITCWGEDSDGQIGLAPVGAP
ncbi:MAG: hypothetical protein D6798_05495 [Deltaproteobacteria bacterium]|nr:MAG: hypothetical protein D6798_05495 [Deltaproteobacteria bacterium]